MLNTIKTFLFPLSPQAQSHVSVQNSGHNSHSSTSLVPYCLDWRALGKTAMARSPRELEEGHGIHYNHNSFPLTTKSQSWLWSPRLFSCVYIEEQNGETEIPFTLWHLGACQVAYDPSSRRGGGGCRKSFLAARESETWTDLPPPRLSLSRNYDIVGLGQALLAKTVQ